MSEPMSHVRALRVIAHQVLANMHASPHDEWENYPEIGEHDWDRIVDLTREMRHQYPSKREYQEAYAVLSARAEELGASR